MVIEAPGTSVKGSVEVDASGDVVSANFPVFSLSDGDKTTLKADRAPDGTLRVTMRGDVYDGRGFVKSAMTGPPAASRSHDKDIDLDVKLGTVVGFHGETLRGLDLRVSRRSGVITSFALNAKLGRDTPLVGDLRGRGNSGRPVVFIETNDAGAFFRFTDIYPKIIGGEMWVALDPQSADQAPQEGILNIRDFSVRGEAALDRVAASGPQQPSGQSPGVEFSRLRVDFTRSPGRFTIRDGLVKGPVDRRHGRRLSSTTTATTCACAAPSCRSTASTTCSARSRSSGCSSAAATKACSASPTRWSARRGAPVLRVNPISAVAPGLLRKFFEFPSGNGAAPQSYVDPRN